MFFITKITLSTEAMDGLRIDKIGVLFEADDLDEEASQGDGEDDK